MSTLNSEQIIAALRKNGSVASRLPSYEPRQAQLDLLALIIQGFNEDSLVMAEAGTGVGKSFAYLLPAMHFALKTKEKVVISTATITLQQQLFEKDIPLVAETMGAEIKSVIMKGRSNYVCLRRLEDVLREPSLFEDNFDEIKLINDWSQKTKTGTRSELSFAPSDMVWASISSESDLCPGLHCPWRESCFVFALRKEAAAAHIIVVNHHLLFADLAARYQGAGYENAVVLPPFNRLIIDEAHTIENAATSFFSAEFGRTGIFRQLGRLLNKSRKKQRGLLVRLCAMLPFTEDAAEDPLDNMADAIDKIRAAAEELDESAMELCGMEGILRLSPVVDESVLKSSLYPPLRSLRKNIHSLDNLVRDILENLDDDSAASPAAWEIKAILKRLGGTAEICDAFCNYKKHSEEVLWMEKHQFSGNPWATLTKTPLDLAPLLKDSIFSPNKTVVCVSATLAVSDDFSYWASRCGINTVENRQLLSGCFPSPFPYSNAVLLAAPVDAPLPDGIGWQDFINNAIGRLAAASGGSALVLFTSYKALQSAHMAAKIELEPLGIKCLKQGDDDRSRLLQTFLSDESACLFATDSFWEGIDAPGDTLRLVIICRLPFRTPGDPVFEARSEAVQKLGGNPFMELSLPQAVMKFKQGFGRLMRRSSDHGVVAVLDGRLLKKNYGQLFLHSLPKTKTCFSNMENILRDMEGFLF